MSKTTTLADEPADADADAVLDAPLETPIETPAAVILEAPVEETAGPFSGIGQTPPPAPTTYLQRMRIERDELGDRLAGLRAFVRTETYGALTLNEQALMQNQAAAMATYLNILEQRIVLAQARGGL